MTLLTQTVDIVRMPIPSMPVVGFVLKSSAFSSLSSFNACARAASSSGLYYVKEMKSVGWNVSLWGCLLSFIVEGSRLGAFAYLRLALRNTQKVEVVDVDFDGLVLQVGPRNAKREFTEIA